VRLIVGFWDTFEVAALACGSLAMTRGNVCPNPLTRADIKSPDKGYLSELGSSLYLDSERFIWLGDLVMYLFNQLSLFTYKGN